MNEAIELGSLEIRKLFKDLNPTALDKKVNVDYLEKELGLKRFFPQSVIDAHKVGGWSISSLLSNSDVLYSLDSCESASKPA